MLAKIWKSSSIFLFYALYILITETAPLRSFGVFSIRGLEQRAAPTAAPSSHDSRIELWQYGRAPHRNEVSTVSTTTRTVTNVVTHTVSWAPPPPTSIKPTKFRTITTNPTTISAARGNNSRLFGNLEELPPETLTQTSILLVAGSIMSLSMLYLAISMLCTLSKHRNIRRYCCFCTKAQKEDQLRGVELEESAGVSWTEGSNVTTPYPEVRLPEGWLGSWADMVAVGGARAFGSTGRSGVGDTVRRNKNGATRGEGMGGAVSGE